MSAAGYPVVLRIFGRRCVVVGGGEVATRKIAALTRDGAELLIVAPAVSDEIERMEEIGALEVERRPFAVRSLPSRPPTVVRSTSWLRTRPGSAAFW
jgi:uroporphyrin-III C-methyltransferase/precorrin-2 dehydrogenase/sirohydrochlorin ferrochelatase